MQETHQDVRQGHRRPVGQQRFVNPLDLRQEILRAAEGEPRAGASEAMSESRQTQMHPNRVKIIININILLLIYHIHVIY